jgi:Fe2+ or Zn2+ uptake regulation protein
MSDQTDNYTHLLTPFGLDSIEAKIYLLLAQKGVLSALQISRELHIARTRVYRILDKLHEKKLVTIHLDDRGQKFGASAYQELELLVAEKEHEAHMLRKKMPLIFDQLAALWGKESARSKVLYYRGVEGLKQVTWNSLRAKDTLRIYEIANMTAFLDADFSEKIRTEFAERHIKVKQLTNLKHIKPYTYIPEHVALWQVRYIVPKALEMKFECMIYNDVFTMYNYQGTDQFCVEIYNPHLSHMQRQLFDYVWASAVPMKILNKWGEAGI